MIALIAVIAISGVLCAFWFRFTCLLILCARTSRDYSGEIASANHLQFSLVERQIATGAAGRTQLDRLQRALARDYDVLQALLRHTAGTSPVEDRILRLDYRLLTLAYQVSRHFSAHHGVRTLDEMCRIVEYFANTMGHRTLACAE